MKINRTGARIVSIAVAAISTAHGAASTAWEMNTWSDFLRGRFQGVALTRDGQLRLGPRTSTLFSDGQSVIWSATEGPDGTIYLGTGHKGRVIAVKAGAAPKVVLEAPQAEVFAVAAAPNGTIYAATSPDGKIYQIQNGKATEYFDPKERYICRLPSRRTARCTRVQVSRVRFMRFAPAGASCTTRPARRTSLRSPLTRRATCLPAAIRTVCSIA